MKKIIFLKLGGSLITNKFKPFSIRMRILKRIIREIEGAMHSDPEIQLLLGHGSGSFGHYAANIYNTVHGVRSIEQWKGFTQVWKDARALNQIVVENLSACGLPVMVFPPSASIFCENKNIVTWDTQPLQKALQLHLIPVTYGDVVFDHSLGGTILSTEELFAYLINKIEPQRILLAGIEEGVWEDYAQKRHLIPKITPDNIYKISNSLGESLAIDVTGGMAQKVKLMLPLVEKHSHLEVNIFSGLIPGMITNALLGESPGTCIRIQ